MGVETDSIGAVWLAVYMTPGPTGQLHYIGEGVFLLFHLCVAAVGFIFFRARSIKVMLLTVTVGSICSLFLILTIMSPQNPSSNQPKALEVYLVDRLGNNLIQWLFANVDADRFGYLVRTKVRERYHSTLSRGKALYGFPNIREDSYGRLGKMQEFARWMDRARGLGDAEEVSCPDDNYKQNYLFFLHHRPLARHLWNASAQAPRIGDDDIAVHFRFLEVNDSSSSPDRDTFVPPYAYFEASVNSSWWPGRRVWVLAEPSQREHATVKRLQHTFGAQVHGGDEKEDWVAGTRAKVFIGSQGTFSWTIAYVSERATRIHLPFIGYLSQGATWLPWCNLFIHDDTRIRYSDVKHPRVALTAQQVTETPPTISTARATPFGKCVTLRTTPSCYINGHTRSTASANTPYQAIVSSSLVWDIRFVFCFFVFVFVFFVLVAKRTLAIIMENGRC